MYILFFFVKQKTAYEMRISDWSSDVCSSDLTGSTQPGSSEREYRFSVGKKYEGKGGGFFYRNLDSIGQYGGDEQFQFSVAQLHDGLDELVREEIGRASCRERVCR